MPKVKHVSGHKPGRTELAGMSQTPRTQGFSSQVSEETRISDFNLNQLTRIRYAHLGVLKELIRGRLTYRISNR